MTRPNGSEFDAPLHAGHSEGYREVLLAYDGSPGARSALRRTAAVALPDTRVTIITVIPTTPSVGSSLDPMQLGWQSRLLTEASAFLREQGIYPFIEAAVGNPELTIRETAQALGVDLVVLGSGDSQRWRQLLQGIECDVLFVAATDDASSE